MYLKCLNFWEHKYHFNCFSQIQENNDLYQMILDGYANLSEYQLWSYMGLTARQKFNFSSFVGYKKSVFFGSFVSMRTVCPAYSLPGLQFSSAIIPWDLVWTMQTFTGFIHDLPQYDAFRASYILLISQSRVTNRLICSQCSSVLCSIRVFAPTLDQNLSSL